MSGAAYLETAIRELRRLQRLADRAIAQVDDDGFFHAPSPEENSIALLVKHLAGNMRSRWTDFLTTDGEKPDRRRQARATGVQRRYQLNPSRNAWSASATFVSP